MSFDLRVEGLSGTGKPYKPTTQGKNERFRQALFRFLDKQAIVDTLEQLQAVGRSVLCDLLHRTTAPSTARPDHSCTGLRGHSVAELPRPVPQPSIPVDDYVGMTRIRDNGTACARGPKFQVSRTLAGATADRAEEDGRLLIYDAHGILPAEYSWPTPVGLGSESLHSPGA